MIDALREFAANYTAVVVVGLASLAVYAPFLGIYFGVRALRRRRSRRAFERRYGL
jgi:hypothetical protein